MLLALISREAWANFRVGKELSAPAGFLEDYRGAATGHVQVPPLAIFVLKSIPVVGGQVERLNSLIAIVQTTNRHFVQSRNLRENNRGSRMADAASD